MIRQISYSHEAFGDTEKLIERAERALSGIEFESMVGTGLSGSLVIPILARAMNKTFAIIRKPNDSSHACCLLEGTIDDSYIIVDDFVSTGATCDRIVAEVERLADERLLPDSPHPRFVGTYQYATIRVHRPWLPANPPPLKTLSINGLTIEF